MTAYRLYLISELTRRFEPAREFNARNDQAAFAVAEQMRSSRDAELWRGNCLVRVWGIDAEATAAGP